jgi:hypothetical protein
MTVVQNGYKKLRLIATTFAIAKLEEQYWKNDHFDGVPKFILRYGATNNIFAIWTLLLSNALHQ